MTRPCQTGYEKHWDFTPPHCPQESQTSAQQKFSHPNVLCFIINVSTLFHLFYPPIDFSYLSNTLQWEQMSCPAPHTIPNCILCMQKIVAGLKNSHKPPTKLPSSMPDKDKQRYARASSIQERETNQKKHRGFPKPHGSCRIVSKLCFPSV